MSATVKETTFMHRIPTITLWDPLSETDKKVRLLQYDFIKTDSECGVPISDWRALELNGSKRRLGLLSFSEVYRGLYMSMSFRDWI
jgi:hypothetical protein